MPRSDSARLLAAWEASAHLPPLPRASCLAEELAGVPPGAPLGHIDRALRGARARWFGPQVRVYLRCPRCQEAQELTLDLRDIVVPDAAPTVAQVGDQAVEVRPIGVDDVLAVEGAADPRRALLSRSLAPGVATAAWPAEHWDQVEQALAEADPGAETVLDTVCSDCGEAWPAVFDISEHLWADLDTHAGQIFEDVARLAAAFGWTEPDVLALSPLRRARYLALVGP